MHYLPTYLPSYVTVLTVLTVVSRERSLFLNSVRQTDRQTNRPTTGLLELLRAAKKGNAVNRRGSVWPSACTHTKSMFPYQNMNGSFSHFPLAV